MQSRLWIAVCGVSLAGACTRVDGECWLRSEDGAGDGVGGGPLVPGGGGFGDVPPTPQDANDPPPPPECLQAPQGACYQKCLKVYETNFAKCGTIEDAVQRQFCQMAAYTAYRTCANGCRQKETSCTDMFVTCQEKGMPCTRQTIWGTTLCAACRDDCQADVPYRTSECHTCGFY